MILDHYPEIIFFKFHISLQLRLNMTYDMYEKLSFKALHMCTILFFSVCYVMLCYVMLSYVMLYNVMLCYVMLCYVMLCYVMLYALCSFVYICVLPRILEIFE